MLDAYIIDKLKQEKSRKDQKDHREWAEISIPHSSYRINRDEPEPKKEKKENSVIIIKM